MAELLGRLELELERREDQMSNGTVAEQKSLNLMCLVKSTLNAKARNKLQL